MPIETGKHLEVGFPVRILQGQYWVPPQFKAGIIIFIGREQVHVKTRHGKIAVPISQVIPVWSRKFYLEQFQTELVRFARAIARLNRYAKIFEENGH